MNVRQLIEDQDDTDKAEVFATRPYFRIELPSEVSGYVKIINSDLAKPEMIKEGKNIEVLVPFNGVVIIGLLAKIGGVFSVQTNATVEAPALVEVGGDLYVSQNGMLEAPALVEVDGGLYVYQKGKLEAPALVEVGGNLYVDQGGMLEAPNLRRQ